MLDRMSRFTSGGVKRMSPLELGLCLYRKNNNSWCTTMYVCMYVCMYVAESYLSRHVMYVCSVGHISYHNV